MPSAQLYYVTNHMYYIFSLLFKGVKSLYFSYSIVNFTALNLQGITSLHLLTSRVECTSLGLTILSLQVALTTLRWCVTRFSALQVLYRNTTLLGLSCCQRRLLWLLHLGRFIVYTLLHFFRVKIELPFENRFVDNSKKRIQVKWIFVKVWVRFLAESCIYLFTISYLATSELRPQFRRTTAPFITNYDSKLPNQTIVASRLSSSPHV